MTDLLCSDNLVAPRKIKADCHKFIESKIAKLWGNGFVDARRFEKEVY